MKESQEPSIFKEKVFPGVGIFIAIAFLFPAILVISEPFNIWIGVVAGALVVVAAWLLLLLQAPQIEVRNDELTVGSARLPLAVISKVEVISKEEIFLERGPNLNPGAFRVFQGSVKTALKIYLSDEKDPTPYWLISTREPQQLAKALLANR